MGYPSKFNGCLAKIKRLPCPIQYISFEIYGPLRPNLQILIQSLWDSFGLQWISTKFTRISFEIDVRPSQIQLCPVKVKRLPCQIQYIAFKIYGAPRPNLQSLIQNWWISCRFH